MLRFAPRGAVAACLGPGFLGRVEFPGGIRSDAPRRHVPEFHGRAGIPYRVLGRRMHGPQRKRACCVRAARALVVLRARMWDHFATTPTGVRLHLRHHGRCCRARTSGCAGDGRGRRPSFRVRGPDANGPQEGCMRRDELTR